MNRILRWLMAVAVGLAFIVAGIGKYVDPVPSERVLGIVGVPHAIARAVMTILPGIEVGLGISLVLAWRSTLVFAASIAMLMAFSVFLIVLAATDYRARCACFGPLVEVWTGGGPIVALMRNAFLLLLMTWPAIDTWLTSRRRRTSAP